VRGCIELLAAHGYVPRVVEPRRSLPEVREGHNRWLVAEGIPFRGAGSPLGTGPDEIGTQAAQTGTEPSHLGAEKVVNVEHEGGGRFPALYGWGVRGPAAEDMSG
jgi:hypothetical protein